jgi:hypothetical protein
MVTWRCPRRPACPPTPSRAAPPPTATGKPASKPQADHYPARPQARAPLPSPQLHNQPLRFPDSHGDKIAPHQQARAHALRRDETMPDHAHHADNPTQAAPSAQLPPRSKHSGSHPAPLPSGSSAATQPSRATSETQNPARSLLTSLLQSLARSLMSSLRKSLVQLLMQPPASLIPQTLPPVL